MITALFGLVDGAILLHGDEQDMVFEKSQQEDYKRLNTWIKRLSERNIR
tara:strand:- start:173 stop:319 length:147 start_codon:yes stop_codon:yes gene_type:complete